MTSREQIMTALFNLVSAAVYIGTATPVFLTASRKLKLWGEVKPRARPAVYVVEHTETHLQKAQGLPTIRTLEAKLYIYFSPPDPNSPGGTTLNNILDAIDSVTGGVMKPDTITNRQSLGGLVQHAWIEGEVFKDPGDIDGDGLIIIPIKILIP